MHTVCGTVLRTCYTRIQNYADGDGETATGGNFPLSYAAPQHIRTAHIIIWLQKLRSQLLGFITAVMYQVQFRLWYGSPTREHININSVGNAHQLLFFHVGPTNQSTITVWTFSIKMSDLLSSLNTYHSIPTICIIS
jgi:hypothetical protein